MPGDVLKVFHFIGQRKKRNYMYKICFELNGMLRAAHAHNVYKEGLSISNSYSLKNQESKNIEIVEGYFDGIPFDERDRV